MKLAINATFLNEKPTGVGVFTREVCRHLCVLERGICIFTSVPMESVGGPHIRRTPQSVQGSLQTARNIKRFVYMNTVLPLITRNIGTDILFCPIVEYPFIPLSPLVVMVHDLHPVYFPEQFGLSARHFKFSLRLLPRLARRIIVPSHFVERELLKSLDVDAERIDVIPPGYDAARFRPRRDSVETDFPAAYGIKRPFVLFVGSLFPYKNVKVLINAFAAIKDRIPHSLVIIGRKDLSAGPFREDERIYYLDYVRNDELPAFYAHADMLVHPSLVEGFGMTILEAMACGTPVISSDRGSLPETVGDAGIFFNPEDSSALGEVMLKLTRNECLRRDIIERGFINVRRYSWQKTAERILETCEKALKSGR